MISKTIRGCSRIVLCSVCCLGTIAAAQAERSTIVEGDPLIRVVARDAIRSIDKPKMVDAARASRRIEDWEPVLGVFDGENARAYPVRLLDLHEIVNDRLADRPIAATW